MKALFEKTLFGTETENKLETVRLTLLSVSVFALPFDLFYGSISFISFCFVTLLSLNRKKLGSFSKYFWWFQGIFLLSLSGVLFSLHKDQASFLLERQLTIFLAPIFLPIGIRINELNIRRLLWTLSISCFLAVAFLMASLFYKIIFVLHLPFLSSIMGGIFFNHEFSRPLGIHAGYLSLYIAFAAIFLVTEQAKQSQPIYRIMVKLGIGFFLLGLFFLASRNIIISLCLILIFIYPLFVIKKKARYFLVSFLLLIGMIVLVAKVPYLKNRFLNEFVIELKSSQNGHYYNVSVLEPRIERWKGAAELISKSFWIGYGTGDEVSMLKTEYSKRGLYISYLENFNAHNQYLSILIKHGIIGLIFFIACFVFYAKLAIQRKDFLYISFLTLFLIGFYTENLLDANKGIVFFAYFNVLFGCLAFKKQNT